MSFAGMMVVALAVDLAFGWPTILYRRIGHPVTWLGALIGACDRRLNRGGRRERFVKGMIAAVWVIAVAGAAGLIVQALLPADWRGTVIGGILAWPLVAMRSMRDHVIRVARPLMAGDLAWARQEVAMIVGRDPERLDAAGVGRATLESLAENASDGIVAPIFWGAVFGLPGIAAYKAVNTLDSMIGHRTPRHEDFGCAAARIDDAVNLIPARLTGALFALVSGRARQAFRIMRRDARAHRSPNAGWPEAALAAGLGIRLSGPRVYHDRVAEEPWLNGLAPDPEPADIGRGIALYWRAMALLAAGLALAALCGL